MQSRLPPACSVSTVAGRCRGLARLADRELPV